MITLSTLNLLHLTVKIVAACSHGEKDPAVLSQKLAQQYDKISDYMAANRLVINGDKTHIEAFRCSHR